MVPAPTSLESPLSTMSITVLPASPKTELHQSTDNDDPCQSDSSSASEAHVPQLPTEVLERVFQFANTETPSPLISVLRVNKLCNELVAPFAYTTVYLNRQSLPFLADTCHSWYDNVPKQEAFTRFTKLVIDDIQVLFDCAFDKNLKLFCENVRLSNVSKIIFCQPKAVPWTYQDGDNNVIKHHSRAAMFARVLPARVKDICIQIPKNGLFQGLGGASRFRDRWLGHFRNQREVLTSTRIMDYITCFPGKLSIRIHQSVNERYITLNDVRRATTVYSFYPDPSGQPGRKQIYLAAEKWMIRHVWLVMWTNYWEVPSYDPGLSRFKTILESDSDPEEMRLAAEKVIEEPVGRWQTIGVVWQWSLDLILRKCFLELMRALNPDSQSACPCCEEVGSSLNE